MFTQNFVKCSDSRVNVLTEKSKTYSDDAENVAEKVTISEKKIKWAKPNIKYFC